MTHELKLEIIKKDGALEQKSNLIEDLRRQLDCEITGLKTYEKGIHTLIIFQHKIIFILLQNNCFQGYTGIILSVHPVYKNSSFCQSTGESIKSHLVTTLVQFAVIDQLWHCSVISFS